MEGEPYLMKALSRVKLLSHRLKLGGLRLWLVKDREKLEPGPSSR